MKTRYYLEYKDTDTGGIIDTIVEANNSIEAIKLGRNYITENEYGFEEWVLISIFKEI